MQEINKHQLKTLLIDIDSELRKQGYPKEGSLRKRVRDTVTAIDRRAKWNVNNVMLPDLINELNLITEQIKSIYQQTN